MQAIQIQQDAILELDASVIGSAPQARVGAGWKKLRDFRNLVAGHPAKRTVGVPGTQRAFMGRRFGSYDYLTFELWDTYAAAQPQPPGKAFPGTSFPTVNLRQMICDYAEEAESVLTSVLETMRTRWPQET
jgi:hypothetical protein